MSLNTQLVRSLKAPARPVWEEAPGKAGSARKGSILALCCLAVLGPLWIVIVTSLSKPSTRRPGDPQGITFVPTNCSAAARSARSSWVTWSARCSP